MNRKDNYRFKMFKGDRRPRTKCGSNLARIYFKKNLRLDKMSGENFFSFIQQILFLCVHCQIKVEIHQMVRNAT